MPPTLPSHLANQEWHRASVAELSHALAEGRVTSAALVEHLLGRIDRSSDELNAFITVTGQRARQEARDADLRRKAGQSGPLTGVPIAHKDLFCTAGVLTSCGSRMLGNFIAPYDATVVSRFAAAGCPLLGKTNMDEFAMGSSNENSYYQAVRNPFDSNRVPGGSSGGSAAAVAARLTPGATGTDTGGSIRQPAAFCGVTGIKPTYGRVSRYGMVAFASSLDQGGPLARSAADCALLLGAMAGHDARDATSIDAPVEDYTRALDVDVNGLTIGLPAEYFANLDARTAAALTDVRKALEAKGCRFVDVSLPNTQYAIPVYYVIAPAEASANLARYDGVRFGHRCDKPKDIFDLYRRSRAEGFGEEVKRRILTGTYVLSVGYHDAYYVQAQRIRRMIRDDYLRAFQSVQALLAPTTPDVAFPLGAIADPVAMYQQDIYTTPANLAGLPAMSLPIGQVNGLPLGGQLIGPHFSEARLLNLAHHFQNVTDWHTREPATYIGASAAGAEAGR